MEKYKKLVIALMACYEVFCESLHDHPTDDCDCREELYDGVHKKANDIVKALFPNVVDANVAKGVSLLLADAYSPPRAALVVLRDSEYYEDYFRIFNAANSKEDDTMKALKAILAKILR